MRVFADANVLFAAAISAGGRSAALFALSEIGLCQLMTSPHAVAEARRNLKARYPQTLDRFEWLLQGVVIVAEAPPTGVAWARGQELPEEDAPILAAAVAARADVLVTGDRTHFGHLFKHAPGGVRVLSLANTLDLLLREKRTGGSR